MSIKFYSYVTLLLTTILVSTQDAISFNGDVIDSVFRVKESLLSLQKYCKEQMEIELPLVFSKKL